ncbi:MAG: hypothetical protein IT359_10875 [Gemmatimonadaceae bacterium]|nr:hypothetical protein [Gemmatimonadaceae bacterium]
MTPQTSPLNEQDRLQLQSFRRAAGRLYDRVLPYASHQFGARMFRADLPDEADLIPEADFFALMVAFRLVYAQKEPTNFNKVANLAYRVGSEEVRDLVVQLRDAWKQSFRRPIVFAIHDEHFDAEFILHTWMNGEVFHQDAHLQRRADLIREEGALTLLTMQWAVRDACFAVLGLDNTCALVLGDQLRAIPPHPYRKPLSLSEGTG